MRSSILLRPIGMDCEVVVIELGCEYDLRSEDERAPVDSSLVSIIYPILCIETCAHRYFDHLISGEPE